MLAIDDYVKKVSSISRRWYSDSQLNPQLDRLVQASHQTLEIMGELHNSLKCDQLYRYRYLPSIPLTLLGLSFDFVCIPEPDSNQN